MKTIFEKIFWFALALLALVSVVAGFRNGLQLVDFQWLPVKILCNGENPYLYSLNGVKFMGCQVDANQVPSCLALLLPFAFLSRWWANAAWDVLNLIFTAAFFFFVWKLWFEDRLEGGSFWLVVLITLIGLPWRVLVGNGQHLMFSLAFFTAALFAAERGRKFLSGVLLALSLFKYTTIAPLCFIFLFRKEWRAIVICAVIHLFLTFGAGVYLGENPVLLVLQSLKVGSGLTAAGIADIASLFASFDVGHLKMWANMGYVIYGALCFLIAFVGKKDALLKLSALAIVSNVMFYHRVYDFVTLLFPLVLVIRDWRKQDTLNRIIRYLTIVNIVWTFFVLKAVDIAHIYCHPVAITFSLEHLLLGSLILLSFRRNLKTTQSSNGAE